MPKDLIWTPEEDQLILQLTAQYHMQFPTQSVSWQTVAKQLAQHRFTKTPKQCQYRWNYALRPGLSKQAEWTQNQLKELFALQEMYGNKWTLIACMLKDKSEHQAKNCFYSTLRKAIRLLNSYIASHRSEAFFKAKKAIKESCIAKIVAQDQGKSKKLRTTRVDLPKIAKEIKTNLLRLTSYQDDACLMKKVVAQLADFNKSCRKIKAKRARPTNSSFSARSCSSEQSLKLHNIVKHEQPSDSEQKDHQSKYYLDDSGVEDDFQEQPSKSLIKEHFLPLTVRKEFWVDDVLEEQIEIGYKFYGQVQGKKDALALEPTRDTLEGEAQEKPVQTKQIQKSGFIWEQLPIDGILNLPALESLINTKAQQEGKPVDLQFIVFKDQEGEISPSNFEKEMEYVVECPFNQYFN